MEQNKLTGGCLCGSVRYSISEKPQRGYICHCRFCQKQTGTGARPAISVDKSSVEFSGTTISQFKYVIPDHGRAIHPMFCNQCGTNLGSTLERFPDAQIINIGTLDNPDDVEVTMEYFSDESIECVTHSPSHTVYHRHRLNEDGSPANPKII
tara:strand:+ start:204 stop:659 length:456 start_codon:yes stop_codon:yes gene_type:complete